ncbi:YqhR family membrane protein [Paenibacillus soyae]|uniref:YqhR family membrane protein n=1 Tax=Paenibacillus soyae TaxID=2969249 RepID=A0A9X2MMK6_9BACL|nr:YqhR family membrane protein [Paenibacillus soyae]MCR2803130.1 YqhR family membrane protein [Paenibacillus soyae]
MNIQARSKLNDTEKKHRTNPWLYPMEIGFFAGLFFCVLRWICYEMNFTKVLPGFLADNFFEQSFLRAGWGIVIGIASFIVFSIIAALLYKVALGKLRGPWAGIFYGLIWWAVIFAGIGPLLGITGWLNEIGWNTIFTEACIFTVWGVFIGYSIAFEFNDEASREPMTAKS